MSGEQVDENEAAARRKRLVIIIAVAFVLGGGLYVSGWLLAQRDADQASGIEQRVETELVARWTYEELLELRAVSSVQEWEAVPGDDPPSFIAALSTSEESPTWIGSSRDVLTAHYPAGLSCVVLRWDPDGASVTTVEQTCENVIPTS